ncbi:hypothetical protein CCH79_00020055 [Gambusia affinis]|uniref:Uncharacterized protein n=1 Tax=Gambusia affinis TaxID=33528 RepID=A0A315UX16_GAMAF|nr:hypothetical protein CCH79_00020055 [Gambusia affinis]
MDFLLDWQQTGKSRTAALSPQRAAPSSAGSPAWVGSGRVGSTPRCDMAELGKGVTAGKLALNVQKRLNRAQEKVGGDPGSGRHWIPGPVRSSLVRLQLGLRRNRNQNQNQNQGP